MLPDNYSTRESSKILRKVKSGNKRFLTLALWGNLFGYMCARFIISEKYAFESFKLTDVFEYILCLLILGLPGAYYTIIETNNDNRNNALGRLIENIWFTALMSFCLGILGIILGLASR